MSLFIFRRIRFHFHRRPALTQASELLGFGGVLANLFLDRAEAGVLYANRASGATTGAWPGIQSFCGWKGSGVSNKGGLGPHYLPQFMREQSRTIMR